MKKQASALIVLAALALFSFTAGPGPGKKAATLNVDPKNSTIVWTGKKITGSHQGTVNVANGKLQVDGKSIKSGSFDIDLTSIVVTDLTDTDLNAKLLKHLKSDDFFSVEKHPKATFALTSVTPKGGDNYDVKGKLTIKGITNEVAFPAVIKTDGSKLTATAKVKVDRTKYDIKYNSANFFQNLGDKAIYDDFELDVKLVAQDALAAR